MTWYMSSAKQRNCQSIPVPTSQNDKSAQHVTHLVWVCLTLGPVVVEVADIISLRGAGGASGNAYVRKCG